MRCMRSMSALQPCLRLSALRPMSEAFAKVGQHGGGAGEAVGARCGRRSSGLWHWLAAEERERLVLGWAGPGVFRLESAGGRLRRAGGWT